MYCKQCNFFHISTASNLQLICIHLLLLCIVCKAPSAFYVSVLNGDCILLVFLTYKYWSKLAKKKKNTILVYVISFTRER